VASRNCVTADRQHFLLAISGAYRESQLASWQIEHGTVRHRIEGPYVGSHLARCQFADASRDRSAEQARVQVILGIACAHLCFPAAAKIYARTQRSEQLIARGFLCIA